MTMVTISRHRKGIPAILRLFSYRRSILCIITLSLFSCYWSILSTTFTKSGEPIQPSSQKITITTIPDDNPKTSDSPKESINPQRIRPIKIKKPSTTTTNDESTPDKPPLAAWKWSHNTSWCTPQNPTTISERPTTPLPPNPTGLIYVKVPKTASSTLSGIALRIAHHVGNRTLLQNNTNNNNQTTTNNNITPCTNLVRHLNMKTNETYATRKPPPDSFLWSMIRDPLKRQLSAVFHFKISRRDVKPTDANVKKLMSSDNPQLNYLAFDRSPEGMISTAQPPFAHLHRKGGGGNGRNAAWILSNNKELTTILPSHVSRIVDGYDFIGITERINESLVVLKFLLGLETTDILYLNAKASGGYDDGEFQDRCVKIQKSFVSEGVKKFLEGRQWKTSVRGDELLYEMVNRKLDATIEEIGKERFREALEEFEEVLRRGDEMCADEAVFPCSKEGVLQREEAEKSCYWADSGCGYPCLDTISV